jgi:hypothetical protein
MVAVEIRETGRIPTATGTLRPTTFKLNSQPELSERIRSLANTLAAISVIEP